MKRRKFALAGMASAAAIGAGLGLPKYARAALTTTDADRLKSDLTPIGAERAGNADGTIPAWTGENLPLPSGGPPYALLPDFFASDAKVVTITVSNMDQYKDKLSLGTVEMLQRYSSFRVNVYPTHRTAIASQDVYDNAYKNVTRTQAVPGGSRMGFTGAYGAIPWPIPDPADPLEAGAQIIYNHRARWAGISRKRALLTFSMINGQRVLIENVNEIQNRPLYYLDGSPETFDGLLSKTRYDQEGPPAIKGTSYIEDQSASESIVPTMVWEYLSGQSRVRKAPDIMNDSPNTEMGDIVNTDEGYLWNNPLDQYNWRLIGKKEIYVPYNNNKLFLATPDEAMLPQCMNPDMVRWELHRVWVVEATLHPGYRNVLPRRTFYVDEDTWIISLYEAYDANGNMVHVGQNYLENRPDIPAVLQSSTGTNNFQTDEYVIVTSPFNAPGGNGILDLTPIPDTFFNPSEMASQQQY